VAALEARAGRQRERLDDRQWQRRWQGWVDSTVAATRAGGEAVIVVKQSRRAYLVRGARAVAAYPAELGRAGLADKVHAGDAATPEGRYRVTEKRDRGATRFYRALMLDYPNPEDHRRFAEDRRRGRIPPGRGIGGLIEIHGEGGRGINWTDGCVALANPDMDRLFAAVRVGTPVTNVGRATLPGAGEETAR
jgi:murein L,D-transpeptidase YafK